MENKKIIEGYVASLTMATMPLFKEATKKIQDGEILSVTFTINDKSRFSRIVVNEKKLDGSETPFGKIVPADNENYAELLEHVKAGNTFGVIQKTKGTGLIATFQGNAMTTPALVAEVGEEEKDRVKAVLGNERYDYLISELKKHGITEGSIVFKTVLGMITSSDEAFVEHPKPYKNLLPKGQKSVIDRMLSNIAAGNSTILEGEKSLGKDVAWNYVADLLNAKIVPVQCHERMSYADLMGYLSSDNTTKQGITEENLQAKITACATGQWSEKAKAYQLALDKSQSPELVFTNGPVVEALQRANNGYLTILLLDEFNLADGNLMSGVFNMITDKSSDHIFVSGLGDVPIPKKNLIIGATQNPATGAYSGLNQQNTATMSRFSLIAMPRIKNIAPILEREAANYGVPDIIIGKLNAVYAAFKTLSLEGEDSISADSLNIRGFEAAVRLIGVGYSAKDAVTEAVINTVSDYEEREVLEQALDNLVDKNGNFTA